MRQLLKLLPLRLAGDTCRQDIARKLHLLTDRSPAVTWSQLSTLRCRANCHAVSANIVKENKIKQWSTPLTLKEPEYDLDYLLNPENYETIKQNTKNRKGVGNIDVVLQLWERLGAENHPDKKEVLRREFLESVGNIPNQTHPETPIGEEDTAKVAGTVGCQREFSFNPRTIVELGKELNMLKTRNLQYTTGHGTYFLVDQLAMLEQALVRYTIHFLKHKGFEMVSVPDIIDPQIIEACGFKTRGEVTQVYRLDPSRHDNLCLAGTSEMPLAASFIDEVINEEDLPKRVAAVSRCYRAEVSKVEEESGIYRVHQFTKVEMFGLAARGAGEALLAELVDTEIALFSQLGLHFRILNMPTTELGAPAYRKYDIETWLPGNSFWGEISSASNCTDYQSRRLNIKYKTRDGQLRHCDTVNGTACAVPRTILALCENHQQEDGSIVIPEMLRPYMDGLDKIEKGLPDLGTHIKNFKKQDFT